MKSCFSLNVQYKNTWYWYEAEHFFTFVISHHLRDITCFCRLSFVQHGNVMSYVKLYTHMLYAWRGECLNMCAPSSSINVCMHVCRWVYSGTLRGCVFGEVGVAEPGHSCTPRGEGRGISLSELHYFRWTASVGERDEVKREDEEPREKGDVDGREGGEVVRDEETDRRERSASEVWAGEWRRSRWEKRGGTCEGEVFYFPL